MATVPMSHPATAVKNPDGTWSVRIQHTAEGSITTVDFTNSYFAEVLSKGYADMLNGKAVVETKIGQLASDLGPAVADAKLDLVKLIADAQDEAKKLITAAMTEAGKIKADTVALCESADTEVASLKVEAEKLLTAAKAEAEKLLSEARAEVAKIMHTVASKVEPTPAPVAPTPYQSGVGIISKVEPTPTPNPPPFSPAPVAATKAPKPVVEEEEE
jgi:vacuolar-type H+-ATPase subunit H